MSQAAADAARRQLEASETPTFAPLAGPFADERRVVLLPGAFDPPTTAHLALAETVRADGFDRIYLSIGAQTIDKPAPGLSITDRAVLLAQLVAERAGLEVALHSGGVYAEQAEAARRALPGLEDLAFAVGMDKLPLIFDRRYYDDAEAALGHLFEHARLVVAPRGRDEIHALERVLESPLARPHRDRIAWVELSPRWRDSSSTAIREALLRGEALPEGEVPEVVAEHLRRRRPY